MHMCYLMGQYLNEFLDKFDILTLIFSGLCHDISH
jgi:hypothetical protein